MWPRPRTETETDMTETTNLELPLFESTDRVDLIAVYNAAMQILDTAVATASAAASAAQTAAGQAQTAASAAQTTANTLNTRLTKTASGFTVGQLASAITTTGGYVANPDA